MKSSFSSGLVDKQAYDTRQTGWTLSYLTYGTGPVYRYTGTPGHLDAGPLPPPLESQKPTVSDRRELKGAEQQDVMKVARFANSPSKSLEISESTSNSPSAIPVANSSARRSVEQAGQEPPRCTGTHRQPPPTRGPPV
ncbi:hypothetical protein EYF80_055512 [Liparis tanakae]|uniref:Uncharacterized protein n=1 Tax=Liparis tanakae TaxID=230148 RepID=A0A4Z2F0Q0_9TELE|nr:hypothetical protein EYF80_055512 [Liparis tanakae]